LCVLGAQSSGDNREAIPGAAIRDSRKAPWRLMGPSRNPNGSRFLKC